MYESLRKVPLFADLPDSDFGNLCRWVEEVRLSAREGLLPEGSPGERAYVFIEGKLVIFKASSGREALLGVHDQSRVIGKAPSFGAAKRVSNHSSYLPNPSIPHWYDPEDCMGLSEGCYSCSTAIWLELKIEKGSCYTPCEGAQHFWVSSYL